MAKVRLPGTFVVNQEKWDAAVAASLERLGWTPPDPGPEPPDPGPGPGPEPPTWEEPPPTSDVVEANNTAELQAALSSMREGRTIVLKPDEEYRVSIGWRWSNSQLRCDGGQARIFTPGANGLTAHGWSDTPPVLENVAFIGLEFDDGGSSSPAMGLDWLKETVGLYFSRVRWLQYGNNRLQAPSRGATRDVTFRGCAFLDSRASAASHAGRAQGLYHFGLEDWRFITCVFADNGYPANKYSHGLYGDADNGLGHVEDCIFMTNSSHGIQLRPGGKLIGNVFSGNAIQALFGTSQNVGPVTGESNGNLFLAPRKADFGDGPLGWSLDVSDNASVTTSGDMYATDCPPPQVHGSYTWEEGEGPIDVQPMVLVAEAVRAQRVTAAQIIAQAVPVDSERFSQGPYR